MNALFHLTRTVWIEYIRRKDFYVVLILTGLFALAALAARMIGIKTAAEAEFLMSFGLTLAYLLTGVVTINLASRQIPREFDDRTIYPLLARPVTRGAILTGKILGVSVLAAFTLLLLSLLSYLPTPKSDTQSLLTLFQLLALQSLALLLLTVLTVALSLFTPPIVSALIALAVFVLGGTLANGLAFALRDTPPAVAALLTRAASLIPDFSLFEHITRFVQGQPPLATPDIAALAGYAALLALFYYSLASWCFARRQL